jgi:hypothetical protein
MALEQYRVLAYVGGYEEFADRVHLVPLDLSSAWGLMKARAELGDMHERLSRALKLKTDDERARLTLRVYEHTLARKGKYVMDWVA